METKHLVTGGVSVEERVAIEALIADGAWRIDHGQAHTIWQQCAENVVLYGLRPGQDLVGRDAVRAWSESRAAARYTTRHVVTNLRVYRDAAGELRSTAVMTMYRHEGEGMGAPHPFMVGDYEDKWVPGADGGWLLAERRIGWAFMAPAR